MSSWGCRAVPDKEVQEVRLHPLQRRLRANAKHHHRHHRRHPVRRTLLDGFDMEFARASPDRRVKAEAAAVMRMFSKCGRTSAKSGTGTNCQETHPNTQFEGRGGGGWREWLWENLEVRVCDRIIESRKRFPTTCWTMCLFYWVCGVLAITPAAFEPSLNQGHQHRRELR